MNQKDVVNAEQKENKVEDQETAISRNTAKKQDPFLRGLFFVLTKYDIQKMRKINQNINKI
jgi:hypothetical protein